MYIDVDGVTVITKSYNKDDGNDYCGHPGY